MPSTFFNRLWPSNTTPAMPEPQEEQQQLQLSVIHDPKIDGKSVAIIDLVLVHGFAGNFKNTWTFKQGNSRVFWPEDLLLADETQPRTRILSFGYDTGHLVVASIRSYARSMLTFLGDLREGTEGRPLVFLGHCLGGLIVKQAMRFAEDERSFNSIMSATRSIMFFGTPHGGGKKEDWEKLATGYKALGRGCQMIDVLGKNTDDLTELDEDFARLQHRFTINNFVELSKMPGAKRLIVNETSAGKFPGEGVTGADGDHITMCQFKDACNNAFIRVCRIMREAASREIIGANELTTRGRPTIADNQVAANSQLTINQEFLVGNRVVGRQQLVIPGQADMQESHQEATAGGAAGALDHRASIERRRVRSPANRNILEWESRGGSIEELLEGIDPETEGELARESVRTR